MAIITYFSQENFRLILFVYRSRAQGNGMADSFNRMGVPSHVTSPESIINDISNRYLAIVVCIPADEFHIYDTEYVYSLKVYSIGAPIFAICEPENLSKAKELYTFDDVFTTDMTPHQILTGIQLYQYDNCLARTGVYRLTGLNASLNRNNPEFYFTEFALTHNEKMILRTLIRVYPNPISAKDLLRHAFKKVNTPSISNVRTLICGINKKFKVEFGRKLIEISSDKTGYIIITSRDVVERNIKFSENG